MNATEVCNTCCKPATTVSRLTDEQIEEELRRYERRLRADLEPKGVREDAIVYELLGKLIDLSIRPDYLEAIAAWREAEKTGIFKSGDMDTYFGRVYQETGRVPQMSYKNTLAAYNEMKVDFLNAHPDAKELFLKVAPPHVVKNLYR